MKILVTGFDPFGGEPVNPAIESVKRLPDTIEGAEIVKLEIPTVVYKSLNKIEEKIKEAGSDLKYEVGMKETSRWMNPSSLTDRMPTSPHCRSRLWSRQSMMQAFLLLYPIRQARSSATTYYTVSAISASTSIRARRAASFTSRS